MNYVFSKEVLNRSKYTNKKGYVLLYLPEHPNSYRSGYIYEHRIVVELSIGRYLKKDEIIHHKNEVKDDNRIENLQITTRKEHMQLHNKYHDLKPKIYELYEKGLSVRQIEKEIGVSKSLVHLYCLEKGITRKKKKKGA